MYLKDNGKINNLKVREKSIRVNYPDLYKALKEFSIEYNLIDKPFTEIMYRYSNKIYEDPVCCECNRNKVSYVNFSLGYSRFCCSRCSSLSKITQGKAIETNLKIFGTKYASQNKDIRNRIEQTNIDKRGVKNVSQCEKVKETKKQSNLDRRGVENAFQCEKVKETIVQTNLAKRGVRNVSQCEIVKETRKQSCLDRLGVENAFQSEEKKLIIKEKNLNKRKKKLLKAGIIEKDIINIDELEIFCNTCSCTYKSNVSFILKRTENNINPCTNCIPLRDGSSEAEKELLGFIKKHYNGIIIEKDRSILKPKELDIYLPDINLAFEFNGTYWHNELYVPKNHHLEKTEKCFENGIHLIHVFEYEWMYKKEIVQSYIFNLLNISNKLIINNYIIKEVSIKDSKQFLEKNHIYGYSKSSIKLGFYFENKLVSLMTFEKLRNNATDRFDYKILKFCDILNFSIIDSAAKIFDYFLNKYQPNEIICCDNRYWSNGDFYKKLGFKLDYITKPNYYFIINGIRKNKINNITDKNSKKYYKIYDSGSFKFIYKNTYETLKK